jgi:ABC-type Na+ efflux pump permease subunit
VRPDGDPASETPFEERERRLSLPAGFTAGVLAGEQQEVLFQRTSEGLSAQHDDFRLRRALYTVLADVIAAVAPAPGAPRLADLSAGDLEALRARPRSLALEVSQAGRRKTIPTGFEQAVPGTMVMFTMIVLLTTGASSLLVERRAGLLRRLASAPMRRGAVVLGKWGARVGLAAVQVAFAMAVGRYLFGVRWGDGLPMLGCVLLAYAGLLAALSLLVGTFAKTEGQAIGLSVLFTNVFAALGGCWWPIEVTPRFMQKLALFLPTGWTMDAMHKLVSFGAPASAALPHVVGMGLCALALGALAARFFRFQ